MEHQTLNCKPTDLHKCYNCWEFVISQLIAKKQITLNENYFITNYEDDSHPQGDGEICDDEGDHEKMRL